VTKLPRLTVPTYWGWRGSGMFIPNPVFTHPGSLFCHSLPASVLILPPCLCSDTPSLPLFRFSLTAFRNSAIHFLCSATSSLPSLYLLLPFLFSSTPSLPLFRYSLPAIVLLLPLCLCSATPSLPLLCYSLAASILLLPPCLCSDTPSLPLFWYSLSAYDLILPPCLCSATTPSLPLL
jgi:hypothetical protein